MGWVLGVVECEWLRADWEREKIRTEAEGRRLHERGPSNIGRSASGLGVWLSGCLEAWVHWPTRGDGERATNQQESNENSQIAVWPPRCRGLRCGQAMVRHQMAGASTSTSSGSLSVYMLWGIACLSATNQA